MFKNARYLLDYGLLRDDVMPKVKRKSLNLKRAERLNALREDRLGRLTVAGTARERDIRDLG